MSYHIKNAVLITLAYKNICHIHSNPDQNAFFVTLILSITSKNIRNVRRQPFTHNPRTSASRTRSKVCTNPALEYTENLTF